MALMSCGGADVLTAHVTLPGRGIGTAEVVLDTTEAISGAVTLSALGGLSLAMTVAWGGVNAALLRWEGVLVAGAGGLSKTVSGAFQYAQLADVLGAILSQAGERQSSTIASDVLSISIPHFSLGSWTAAGALEQLSLEASRAMGQPVTWRVLSDGTVWIGVESWPSQSLPDGADILDTSANDQRTVIGAQTPALLPGVDLDAVGRVVAVDHWIDAFTVRTWAWTAGGIDSAQQFRRMVRAALALDIDGPLTVDRLALYAAQVNKCASDGSTVDVTPLDARISPIQNVPVRVGIPSAQAVVAAGAVCLLGWDGGDPSKPYAVPSWDAGANLTSLKIAGGTNGVARNGDAVNLGQCYVTMAAGAVATVVIDGTPLPVGTDPAPNRGKVNAGSSIVKVG